MSINNLLLIQAVFNNRLSFLENMEIDCTYMSQNRELEYRLYAITRCKDRNSF